MRSSIAAVDLGRTRVWGYLTGSEEEIPLQRPNRGQSCRLKASPRLSPLSRLFQSFWRCPRLAQPEIRTLLAPAGASTIPTKASTQRLMAGRLRAAYKLPSQPEFLFSEEAAVHRRSWSENLTYYTGTGYVTGIWQVCRAKAEGPANTVRLQCYTALLCTIRMHYPEQVALAA